jgi:3-oxoacyl-ACP reductase-like protein
MTFPRRRLMKCLSKSIKDLVSRKSTLQNEILGDVQQEFSRSSVPLPRREKSYR